MTVDPALALEVDPPLRGEKIGVGVSGGGDSAGALAALAVKARATGASVFAIHVDHQLRADSAADAAAARAQAEASSIPFVSSKVDVRVVGGSVEAAAREARYGAFVDAAEKLSLSRILVAHSRDDAIETIVLALLRGGGPRGLRGMRVRRPLTRGCDVWRPFLETSRVDLRAAGIAAGLRTVEDPTNTDVRVKRAAVRSRLLPALRAVDPAIDDVILDLANACAVVDDLAEEAAMRLLRSPETYAEPGYLRLPLAAFREAARATRARLWLGYAAEDPAFSTFATGSVLARLDDAARRGPIRLELARGLRCDVSSESVALAARTEFPTVRFAFTKEGPNEATLELGGGRSLDIGRDSGAEPPPNLGDDPREMFLAAPIDATFEAGPATSGERFELETGAGTSRVSIVMSERKVPASLRERVPVVRVDGSPRWICGVRRIGAAAPGGAATYRLRIRGPTPWM